MGWNIVAPNKGYQPSWSSYLDSGHFNNPIKLGQASPHLWLNVIVNVWSYDHRLRLSNKSKVEVNVPAKVEDINFPK